MVKKRTGYEPVETWVPDAPAAEPEPASVAEPIGTDFYVLDAEPVAAAPVVSPSIDVRISLPLSVLYALADSMSPLADVGAAEHYGLISTTNGGLTPIGTAVWDACDQTALRHQLNTAYRNAHNAEVGKR